MNINSVPDLPKDFDKAEKVIKFGGTTMGIFNLNGGRLKVAYGYRQWEEDGIFSYQVFGPWRNGPTTRISNILEGMAILSKKNAQVLGKKIHALVAGRAFVFRLFVERKIVNDLLIPTKDGRFQGKVLIGDKTYRFLAEETKNILGSNFQIAFVDKDLRIIG